MQLEFAINKTELRFIQTLSGHSRLRRLLHWINVEPNNLCDWHQDSETIEHFLFHRPTLARHRVPFKNHSLNQPLARNLATIIL